jgi:hypothetical protein
MRTYGPEVRHMGELFMLASNVECHCAPSVFGKAPVLNAEWLTRVLIRESGNITCRQPKGG